MRGVTREEVMANCSVGSTTVGGLHFNSLPFSDFLTQLKHEHHTKDFVVLDMGRHNLQHCRSSAVMHLYQVRWFNADLGHETEPDEMHMNESIKVFT